jgi:calcium/calmodulin-dependent protein kinase (CaM kinase) II
MSPAEAEVIELTTRLLDAIASGDWSTYTDLCDPSLTCFEPEARGHLVQGMPFHKFYFELGGNNTGHTTIASPHVRMLGTDVAIVSYIRLVQQVDSTKQPQTHRFEETRIWHRQNGCWRHMHFHRSANE